MKNRLACAASLFALFLVHFLALLTVAACGGDRPGPEQQLRAWVEAVQVAAEARDRSAIMDRISPSYGDARGNSRGDIDSMLRLYFLRVGRVVLLPRIEEIEVFDGSAARIVLTVGMAGTTDSLLGISADAYRFELELETRGGDWSLLSARWAELGAIPR